MRQSFLAVAVKTKPALGGLLFQKESAQADFVPFVAANSFAGQRGYIVLAHTHYDT
jgi:hypothetical protein